METSSTESVQPNKNQKTHIDDTSHNYTDNDKKIFAVVNPTAGGGRTGKLWPQVLSDLRARGISVEDQFTDYPGHAQKITRNLLENGHETIMAVGGDGTFGEVAGGFYNGDELISAQARMRPFPLGSGCDMALNFNLKPGPGMTKNFKVNGQQHRLDIIELSAEYSAEKSKEEPLNHRSQRKLAVNVTDLGAIARSLDIVHKKGYKKTTFNYVRSALFTALKYSAFSTRVVVDGSLLWEGTALDVFILNGPTLAGGFTLAPPADPTDGQLDVIVLPAIGKLKLSQVVFSLFRGNHLSRPEVKYTRGTSVQVTLQDKGVPLELDGDFMTELPSGEFTFNLKPASLPLEV